MVRTGRQHGEPTERLQLPGGLWRTGTGQDSAFYHHRSARTAFSCNVSTDLIINDPAPDISRPILSHQDQGVAHRSLDGRNHGIVYIGQTPPQALTGERGMVSIPIRIIPDEVTERLKPTSRIHYGKIYTIEHNVKARGLGMVHDAFLDTLLYQQYEVQWRANSSFTRGHERNGTSGQVVGGRQTVTSLPATNTT